MPLGRIVATGERENGSSGYVAVWRLSTAGAFDTTFGTHGLFEMTNTAGQGSSAFDEAWALAIDAQNRPVIVGQSDSPTNDIDMAVWRLTP